MTMPNDKNPREVNPRDENSREANPRDQNHRDKDHGDHTPEPTRGDRLDTLLRAWHDENREGARAMRDEILAQLASGPAPRGVIARIGFARMFSAAAILVFSVVLALLFVQNAEQTAIADSGVVQVAEGGALDALDDDGNTLGPCPLQHTDVQVEISGLFARTVVEQTYANPYPRTIEAVYTFPLSHRAAVDRMTMIVRGPSGEKIVEGEVKERSIARAMYEEARESGYVASLLEQERPNIFTQSVANIEPGATVKVRIATIELAQRRNGVAEYVFPMVVGPRYIPGQPASMPTLPEGWEVRQGVVLRAPAGIEITGESALSAPRLSQLIDRAVPVRAPRTETIDELLQLGDAVQFTARYGNGSSERGAYFPLRGIGEVNGRFFHAPLGAEQGTGFAGDTTQVPDASRITPMPVKPSERAGHDVSVRVTIDSGGPAITDVSSELHAVTVGSAANAPAGGSTRTVTLDDRKTIPNRDFILRWKVADASIEPAFFTHVSESSDAAVKGGYFALLLEPPARVAPAEVRPRELVFVLDVSGSMNGFPIEKSKALARKAIASMRPNDTFNFITFAGATSVLWPEPKPATEENRRAAEEFVNGAYGAGGTEMMAAVNAALVQDGRSGIAPAKLLDLPADGRVVRVAVPHDALVRSGDAWTLAAGGERSVPVELTIAIPANPRKLALIVDGAWETRDGNRVLVTRSARFEDADARTRFVFFLTDGYIGNDQGVIAAIRDNARASRVCSFGIGNSVNRYLLEEMARAGRGSCEIVTLADEADAVIERLTRRIESPVLTDIELDISASLGIREVLPAGDHLPDLHDQEPIVLMGRFDRAASGSITVRGRTGAGPWERTLQVALPATEPGHDVVKTLWARAKVDAVLAPHLAAVESQSLDGAIKRSVIRLGEAYAIATPYTSFVAVEKSRVVVGGKPMLVSVPVELPDGTNWAGFFGDGAFEGSRSERFGVEALGRTLEQQQWFAPPDIESASRGFGDPAGGEVVSAGAPIAVSAAPKPTAPAEVGPSAAPGGAPAPVSAPTVQPPAPPRMGGSMNRGDILEARDGKAKRDAEVAQGQRGAAGSFQGRRMPGAPIDRTAQRSQSFDRSRFAVGEPSGGTTGGLVGGFGGGGGGGAPAHDFAKARGTGLRFADQPVDGLAAAGTGDDANGADSAAAAKPALTEAQRDQLVRVLDRRLVFLALARAVGEEARIAELASELGVPLADGRVTLALKVATGADGAIPAATLDALRALGAEINAQVPVADARRGLVVIRIPATRLLELSAMPGLKRAEPILPS
jgi:hypothetical protein